MATEHFEIPLYLPRWSTLAGAAYFDSEALTDYDSGAFFMKNDVDSKIYGELYVTPRLAGTPNAKIRLIICANATSGVTRLQVGCKAVADAEALNFSAFTDETAIDVTVPATARMRKDVTFPASGNLTEVVAAGDLLIVEIYHIGLHANDTLAVPTQIKRALLIADV
jgi:hypothetical protein